MKNSISQHFTIMVVEDEELLLKAITRKLELIEMKVIACKSAKSALDYLEQNVDLPDAIWLDYYLKDMNGIEFMAKIKDSSKWAKIPVLVVSNSASPDKVNAMMAFGAKKYILKAEHRLEEIISIITNLAEGESSHS